ncbi:MULTISPECIES: type III secretion protein [unclassified Pseudomonas]|uniref:type III secretion protein n=1 Tax=unclassified Pseudomonas TaxID=196821 RepID=UPI0015B49931|nr:MULTISPECIES: type III secretion protein [unclassified Pseudomonas]
MSDAQTWAQWWAYPWTVSSPEWGVPGALKPLYRSQHWLLGKKLSIAPCLPTPPNLALLRLIYGSPGQRELMLALIESICHPKSSSQLSEEHQLWCQRLAKALPPCSPLSEEQDPLRLLREWVPLPTWQRLRLSFPRQRVIELEQIPWLSDAHGRLDTLWQAAIWRATSMESAETHQYQSWEHSINALSSQD